MSDVEMLVAALTVGAAAGVKDTASSGVRDLYAALREAVLRRLAAHGRDVAVLEPGTDSDAAAWRSRLLEELQASGAHQDAQIVTAARLVVDASQAKGVMIGDHNTQTNTFH